MPRSNSQEVYNYDYFKKFGWTEQQFKDFIRRYGISTNVDGYYRFQEGGDVERWLRFLEEYFRRAEPLRGTRFWDQVMANPSLAWQESGMNRGANEAFYNGRENDSYKYLAELLDANSQDKYNSTSAQVERDRAAGFNDAISGQLSGAPPASDAAPLEGGPSPGMSAADQIAQDQMFLGGLGTVFSCLGAFSGVLEGFTKIRDLLSGIELRSTQKSSLEEGINATKAATEAQELANLDALTNSLTNTFVKHIPLPKDGEKWDPKSVMASFPRGIYNDKQLAHLDKLVNSGHFFGPDGTPSLAIQNAYAGGVSQLGSSMANYAQKRSLIGSVDDFEQAFLYHMEKYAKFDQKQIAANAALKDYELDCAALQKSILELQKLRESHLTDTAASQSRSAAARADMDEKFSLYNQELYNSETASAERRVQDLARRARESRNRLDAQYNEFSELVQQDYLDELKEDNSGFFSVGRALIRNTRRGMFLKGFQEFRSGYSTAPDLNTVLNAAGNLVNLDLSGSVSSSQSAGNTVSSSTVGSW